MSTDDRLKHDTQPTELTDDERQLFRRLQDRYEDDIIGRVCEHALQSDSDDEEASNS